MTTNTSSNAPRRATAQELGHKKRRIARQMLHPRCYSLCCKRRYSGAQNCAFWAAELEHTVLQHTHAPRYQ